MVKYENNCVGCPRGMGCIGSSCPYVDVPVHYCDKCGADERLFVYDDQELCIDCILDLLEESTGTCDYCGEEDVCYNFNWECVCRDCIIDMLEVVEGT